LLTLDRELVEFCRGIELDKYVLTDHLQQVHHEAHLKYAAAASSALHSGGNSNAHQPPVHSRAHHRLLGAPMSPVQSHHIVSPSLVVLVKHLKAIKDEELYPGESRISSSKTAENVALLISGLEKVVRTAESVSAKLQHAEENSDSDSDSDSDSSSVSDGMEKDRCRSEEELAALRAVPIGQVPRALSQSKLLLRALKDV
jgi:hypothetical protein